MRSYQNIPEVHTLHRIRYIPAGTVISGVFFFTQKIFFYKSMLTFSAYTFCSLFISRILGQLSHSFLCPVAHRAGYPMHPWRRFQLSSMRIPVFTRKESKLYSVKLRRQFGLVILAGKPTTGNRQDSVICYRWYSMSPVSTGVLLSMPIVVQTSEVTKWCMTL